MIVNWGFIFFLDCFENFEMTIVDYFIYNELFNWKTDLQILINDENDGLLQVLQFTHYVNMFPTRI